MYQALLQKNLPLAEEKAELMCRLQSPMMDFNKNFQILLNMTQGALKNLFAHNEIASWKALCAST